MISLVQLKAHLAAYPDAPPRTLALEQRIRIGTGFHGKWYRSQREHWLGWTVVQECQARMSGQDPSEVDARLVWSRLKCSPMMFWLAEVAGVPSDLMDEAEALAESASEANPADGHPHGRMIRTALPWPLIEQAILTGPPPAPLSVANDAALLAFDRLTESVSTYRKFRQWLPA